MRKPQEQGTVRHCASENCGFHLRILEEKIENVVMVEAPGQGRNLISKQSLEFAFIRTGLAIKTDFILSS